VSWRARRRLSRAGLLTLVVLGGLTGLSLYFGSDYQLISEGRSELMAVPVLGAIAAVATLVWMRRRILPWTESPRELLWRPLAAAVGLGLGFPIAAGMWMNGALDFRTPTRLEAHVTNKFTHGKGNRACSFVLTHASPAAPSP
jgi:hypothetical protein